MIYCLQIKLGTIHSIGFTPFPQSGRLSHNKSVSISCRVGNSVEIPANVRTNVCFLSLICPPRSRTSRFESRTLYLIDDQPVVVGFNFGSYFYFVPNISLFHFIVFILSLCLHVLSMYVWLCPHHGNPSLPAEGKLRCYDDAPFSFPSLSSSCLALTPSLSQGTEEIEKNACVCVCVCVRSSLCFAAWGIEAIWLKGEK